MSKPILSRSFPLENLIIEWNKTLPASVITAYVADKEKQQIWTFGLTSTASLSKAMIAGVLKRELQKVTVPLAVISFQKQDGNKNVVIQTHKCQWEKGMKEYCIQRKPFEPAEFERFLVSVDSNEFDRIVEQVFSDTRLQFSKKELRCVIDDDDWKDLLNSL